MSTTNRLIILTVTVVAVWGVALMLRGTLSTESLPDWILEKLPMELRQSDSDDSETLWKGEKHEVDPMLTQAEDADETLDRFYQDGKGGTISLHLAFFTQYQFGVQHNPMVCYDRQGWKLRDSSDLTLNTAGKKAVDVRISSWENAEGRTMVAYWYQLGSDLVFDRGSLGKARMKHLGKPFKPALLKVLISTHYTSAGDEEAARERLQAMGEHVYGWINRPDHDWVPQKKPQ